MNDGTEVARAGAPAPPITRRELLRRLGAVGAVVGGSSLLAACGSSPSGSHHAAGAAATRHPRHGGDLTVGLSGGSATDTLDAGLALSYIDGQRLMQLYNPLLQLNKDAQTEYQLAESIVPNSSATQWTIHLRRGVEFHNGKELGAEDVIYTFRRILNPKSPLPGATSLGPMDAAGLRALDKYTVLAPMSRPFASFVDQLAYWYFLGIVPVGYDPKRPVGTGPFKYHSFAPGQRSVFVRNENYWKTGLPYLDSVTTIDFADTTSLQNALEAGEVDGAGSLDGVNVKTLTGVSGVFTVPARTGNITPFTMRVDRPPFNDVRVRQALRLLVDRPEMVELGLDGYGDVAADVFSPYDPDYITSLHRERDIPEAKRLLKAAGQSDLSVELVTSDVSTGSVAMATVLARQASAAGVKIHLNTVPSATFFGPNYLQWTFSQDFYNYVPYLAQVADSFLPKSPYNETHWAKPGPSSVAPHYVSLYDAANATTDPAKRRDIVHEMMHIDFNEGAYIIPCFVDAMDAYRSHVGGVVPSKVGLPFSAGDFEHFYLD